MTDTSVAQQNASLARKVLRGFANPVAWIAFLGCAPLLALRILPLLHFNHPGDFALYWSAGSLFLAGDNPYSSHAMLAFELSHGWPFVHPMMFCPPWVLPFAALAAAFSYHGARLGWLAISFLLDCISCIALWRYFGGEFRRAWIAVAFVATFLPMAAAEYLGQITPLVLVSLVIFLFLLRHERDYASGLMLLGVGLKPHLLYLVLLAVLLWAVQHRRWKMIAGAITSYSVAIGAVFIYNPRTLTYLHNSVGPATQVLTGAGGVLRGLFGAQHAWLQFLPTIAGLGWFLFYWLRLRHRWDWEEHLPLLVLVSLCSAPYYWYHDFLLVAPALIYIAVRMKDRLPLLIPGWLLVQCGILFCAHVSAALEATAGLVWIGFYFYARAVRARNYSPQRVESESAV